MTDYTNQNTTCPKCHKVCVIVQVLTSETKLRINCHCTTCNAAIFRELDFTVKDTKAVEFDSAFLKDLHIAPLEGLQ